MKPAACHRAPDPAPPAADTDTPDARPRPEFAVLVLAGGQSRRMGRDKAWLPLAGQPLLARQIALAHQLAPREVFLSGRGETDYHEFGCPVVYDRFPDAGPLAGIVAGLETARAPLVLVLAVDTPHLTRALIEDLLGRCGDGVGVVPRVHGQPEPLVAFYPVRAARVALAMLERQERAVRAFAERCQQAGLITFHDVPPAQHGAFTNWNSPADVAAAEPAGPRLAADQSAVSPPRPASPG
jgi:molybdopterin-guanine dinucleotide biosynthesis protein A